jgi:hypothetical protein
MKNNTFYSTIWLIFLITGTILCGFGKFTSAFPEIFPRLIRHSLADVTTIPMMLLLVHCIVALKFGKFIMSKGEFGRVVVSSLLFLLLWTCEELLSGECDPLDITAYCISCAISIGFAYWIHQKTENYLPTSG